MTMKRTTLLTSLLILSVVGWVLCLLYSLFTQPAIIAGQQITWILSNATLLFIRYLGPLHCTALLIAPSIGAAPRVGEAGYMKPIGPIAAIMLLVIVDSLAILLVEPLLLARRSDSVRAAELIFPAAVSETRLADLLPTDQTAVTNENQGATLPQLLQSSRSFLESGDAVSAHFNAQQALLLDPQNETAQALIDSSRRELARRGLSATEEQTDRRLFERKRAAYLTLIENPDPLVAYTQFWKLRQEFPLDADIIAYTREALRLSRREAFFLEELAPIEPEVPDLGPIFINPLSESRSELVHIGALIEMPYGLYGYDTELIRVNTADQVERHLAADWSKFIADRLNARLVEINNPERRIVPRYYVGRPDGGIDSNTDTAATDAAVQTNSDDYSVLLGIGFDELTSIARLQSNPASVQLPSLWRLMNTRYGIDPRLLQLELATRLLNPFILTLFLLIFAGWGLFWKTSSRGLLALCLPAAIGAAVLAMELYGYAYTRLAALLLERLALVAMIVILAAALLLPIVWSLAFYARATFRRR